MKNLRLISGIRRQHKKLPFRKSVYPVLLGHSCSKTTEIYPLVSEQEVGIIKNPLEDFYKNKSSTIQTDLGSIVEHK